MSYDFSSLILSSTLSSFLCYFAQFDCHPVPVPVPNSQIQMGEGKYFPLCNGLYNNILVPKCFFATSTANTGTLGVTFRVKTNLTAAGMNLRI